MGAASILIIVFVVFSMAGTVSDESGKNNNNFGSPSTKKYDVNLKPTKKVPDNLSKLVYSGSDDFQIISSYIIGNYTKVDPDEAGIIAKSIVKYSTEYHIDPKFVAALIAKESSFNKKAVSCTFAKGLGQIKDFNYPHLKITDPFNIEQNVRGCAMYLSEILNKWKGNSRQTQLTLASYTEGYGAVSRASGNYKKATHKYVNDILAIYKILKSN